MSAPAAIAARASASVAMSAIATAPRALTAAISVPDGTGRGRSVASTATTAAPASSSAATSSRNGVIRTALSARSRLIRPMTGSGQARTTAATLRAPSILSPAAPAACAASA